jgi:NitT/TauT family transport system substrate-binding protein
MNLKSNKHGLALIALLGSFALAREPAQAADHVTYLFPTVLELPAFAPWHIAKFEGYYQQEGLDVEFLVGKGGVDVAKQVGANNADLGGGMGDTAMIVRANDVPVKSVALLGGGGLMQLAVRQDSGIKGIKDLKGKAISTIGFADTTFYALLGMLASVGLTKDDVNAQALGPAGVSQMLISGNVQACACIPEWSVLAQDAGVKLDIYRSDEYIPSMAQAIIASDKTIREKPEVLRKFIKATLRALGELRDDPVKMTKVYIEAVPSQKPKEEYLTRVFQQYAKLVYAGQARLGLMDPARLAKLEDLYLSQNIIRTKPDVNDLFTNEFVP